MIKPLFKATQVALSPAFTGSIVRKQWLKTPHSWLNLSAILNWILSLCIFVIPTLFLVGCSGDELNTSKAESKSLTITEEIEAQANDFLKKDKEISSFVIDSIEYSHENQDSDKVYILTYSMKPSNSENFILAGSGVMGNDGWVKERVYYVNVKDSGELIFSTSP